MTENTINLQAISEATKAAYREIIAEAKHTRPGDIFVLGCSSSEVVGSKIGKNSNPEAGRAIVQALIEVCKEDELFLAVQGCEHINRALVVERETLATYDLEEVNVKPQYDAGGAASVSAWELFEDPVCVEFIEASAGMDVGDTEIAMHIRHVQRPVRPETNFIGSARVTALVYRPKLIGGDRSAHI